MKSSPRRASSSTQVGTRIVRDLEREIVAGRLGAGERLPTEAALRARYGASRAAVREAIQMLKAQGLAESRRGSGTYVLPNAWERPLRQSLARYGSLRGDARAFHELLDLRVVVESFALRRLMAEGHSNARELLATRLAEMEKQRGDLRLFGSADLAFHLEIVQRAGNELLAIIFRGLVSGLGERFARETYTTPDLVDQTLRDHRQILEALVAGREELAVTRLVAHLEWSRRHLDQMHKTPTNLSQSPRDDSEAHSCGEESDMPCRNHLVMRGRRR